MDKGKLMDMSLDFGTKVVVVYKYRRRYNMIRGTYQGYGMTDIFIATPTGVMRLVSISSIQQIKVIRSETP